MKVKSTVCSGVSHWVQINEPFVRMLSVHNIAGMAGMFPMLPVFVFIACLNAKKNRMKLMFMRFQCMQMCSIHSVLFAVNP